MSNSLTLPVFVVNRLVEIRAIKNCYVGYTKTRENPSDLGTRQETDILDLSTISNPDTASERAKMLFCGPPWLCSNQWPPVKLITEKTSYVDSDADSGEEGNCVMCAALNGMHQKEFPVIKGQIVDLARFSKLKKATLTMKVCLDFLMCVGKSRDFDNPMLRKYKQLWRKDDVECMKQANNVLILQEQKIHAPTQQEIMLYGIHLADNGIRVCTDRLCNAIDNTVYLSGKGKLCRLIVMAIHEANFHSGVQQTLSVYRETYWTPKARRMVRAVLKGDCVVCKWLRAIPYKMPAMSPLPRFRVTKNWPFAYTGTDYAGPCYVVDDSKQVRKIWVVIFTCLTTRATDLQMVTSMTALSFMQALRKFINIRGHPFKMLSDNAAQYKLASEALQAEWAPNL